METIAMIKQRTFLWVTCCLWGFSAVIQAVTLDDISYTKAVGDQVQLSITLSEPISSDPLSFSIDNPARIALDFSNTHLGAVKKNQAIGVGVVNSVAAVEAGDRTRIVISLVKATSYAVSRDSNIVTVKIGDNIAAGAAAVAAASTIPEQEDDFGSTVSQSTSDRPQVKNIDFRRGDEGEGRLIITLSDPFTSIDMNKVGDKIKLNLIGAKLPSALDRRLDVLDFATPVKEIDSKSSSGGAQIELSMLDPEYDHLGYQLQNTFIVEVRSLENLASTTDRAKPSFTGERLSLNFQDIEVRAVLQLIADFTELNLVASDTISGNVTLRLKNVPWDQALDIILKSKGLGLRQIDNVIMVAPNAEIAAREKLELEASNQVQELAPLSIDFLQVNYAKANELANLIKAEENNLLSERGSVTVDERTNTLILQDVGANLDGVKHLLSQLDVPVRQVLIESRIVNADESFVKDLGVRFGYSVNTRSNSSISREDVGGGSPPVIFGGTEDGNIENSGGTFLAEAEGLLVNLPAAARGAAAEILVGKIGSYLLQLELSALIADGRGENIASPKIITANQRQARIESGIEIPFQEASASGATTTAFKQAVLALDVTPQITPDDRVLLDLEVSQDTPGTPVIGGIPINTRRVKTQVLVDNGETVVLGGVYTQSDLDSVNRVPFFSDLPYVGFLFKQSNKRREKSELLIFVTPKILKDAPTI